jgi:hypothetical protein
VRRSADARGARAAERGCARLVAGPLLAGGLFQAVGPGAPYLVAGVLAVFCLALVPDFLPDAGAVATEITGR